MNRWHDVHDEYVAAHGDDERPEAVASADRAVRDPLFGMSMGPGAVWPVSSSNFGQIIAMKGETQRALLYGAK